MSSDFHQLRPFQIRTSLKGKNLLSDAANSFLLEMFPVVWNNIR